MPAPNPYNWQTHRPPHPLIRHSLIQEACAHLLEGSGCVVLGGHGSGKSVFLRQVAEDLSQRDGIKVIHFAGPPQKRTTDGALATIARTLGVPWTEGQDAQAIFDAFFRTNQSSQSITLIYDELDQYINTSTSGTAILGRELFNNIESARRELSPKIGVLAAGGLGLFFLRDILGSSFISRAAWLELEPFSEEELQALTTPFLATATAEPSAPNIVSAIGLMSGGNPALATFALQRLWGRTGLREADVADLFTLLRERHPEFFRAFWRALVDPVLSEIPRRVWNEIRTGPNPIPRKALLDAFVTTNDRLRLDLDDVLRLLKAAGLIRLSGSRLADPLQVHPISSILSLHSERIEADSLQRQLVVDLSRILGSIHTMAPDFFRGAKNARTLVPEAVFSAFLTLGMREAGWSVEREAQYGAGRTDLKLKHSKFHEIGIVEVKIWPRNDYKHIHNQAASYWSADVTAGACVMISDSSSTKWREEYTQECLSGKTSMFSEKESSHPLAGHFFATSSLPSGVNVSIDHLLLRLPNR